jgi:hypothetical protein
MSVSSISHPVPAAVAQKGDPTAVEAPESAKIKQAEKQNGSVAPSGASNATHHILNELA